MIKLKLLLKENSNSLSSEVKNLEARLISEFPQLDILELYMRINGSLYIDNIKIKKEFRGQGIGRQVIDRIKKFADDRGLIITLGREESEPKYKNKLKNFYTSAGFVDNVGKNRDDALSNVFGKSMYRKPNVNEEFNSKIDVPFVSMFPKNFDRESLGSCMVAAEEATKFLLSKNITNFKVIEGWITLDPDWRETGNLDSHTWLKINGRIFDPTKKQFEKWYGDKYKNIKYIKTQKIYSPQQYLDLCKKYPGDINKFLKKS